MPESKSKVWDTILGVLVAISLGLGGWGGSKIVEHEKLMAELGNQMRVNTDRLALIESGGSRALDSHVKVDDQRVNDMRQDIVRLEGAIVQIATMPGEIKAIGIRLDSLKEGQVRIEKAVEDHIKSK